MTAKQKRIYERLTQILQRSQEMAVSSSAADPGADLAMEASQLGLELLEKEK